MDIFSIKIILKYTILSSQFYKVLATTLNILTYMIKLFIYLCIFLDFLYLLISDDKYSIYILFKIIFFYTCVFNVYMYCNDYLIFLFES